MRLCVHTDFLNGRPVRAYTKLKGKTRTIDLYKRGTGLSIYDIEARRKQVGELITKCIDQRIPVVATNFKNHLANYPIPLYKTKCDVYDLAMESETIPEDRVEPLLQSMEESPLQPYQKICANAAVVYQFMQNQGVLHGGMFKTPVWSHTTSTGRSKTTGFNVHGCSEEDEIAHPQSNDTWYYVHFDWISADIRVASLLSGDEALQEAFRASDPYTFMADIFGDASLDRDACKIALLRAINSLDVEDVVLTDVFKKLGDWISRSKQIGMAEGKLKTPLGKKFVVGESLKPAINGMMQGTVVHAMRLAMRDVWEKYEDKLFMEVHDSLVMHCPPGMVKTIIKDVSAIMTRPFSSYPEFDHFFPLKVSVGKKWKKWNPVAVYREDGPHYVKKSRAAEGREESSGDQEGTVEATAPPLVPEGVA